MSRLSFLRSWFALPIVLALAGALVPSIARAQLGIREEGSTWNNQTLKTATVKVTGATPGNIVWVMINSADMATAKVNIKSGVTDNAGEIVFQFETRVIRAPEAATYNFANDDVICISERTGVGPPIPPAVAKAKGQFKADGGIKNLGPCPEPALVVKGSRTDSGCPDCDSAQSAPGLSPLAGAVLALALGAWGLGRVARGAKGARTA